MTGPHVETWHVLDNAAIQKMLNSPRGGVATDLMRRGYRVETRAKQLCRVDHGRLRSSITSQLVRATNGRIAVRVGTNVKYARWVHDGTGLYGPHHQRIYPTHASVMVWQSKRSKRLVFARSTAGMKGTPFLQLALAAAHG